MTPAIGGKKALLLSITSGGEKRYKQIKTPYPELKRLEFIARKRQYNCDFKSSPRQALTEFRRTAAATWHTIGDPPYFYRR
jgi:hypothetical protein